MNGHTFIFRRCTATSLDNVIVATFYLARLFGVDISVAVEHAHGSITVCTIGFIRRLQVYHLQENYFSSEINVVTKYSPVNKEVIKLNPT